MRNHGDGSITEPLDQEAGKVRIPGMLMIGAADRRCGKTTLAVRLVQQLARDRSVAAIKVTTAHERGSARTCPRGGDGCGVCSSLETDMRITEETGGAPGKDTTRLYEGGARPVLWLCVRPSALGAGAAELSSRLEAVSASVCESNSLRKGVEPDLFVIVRRKGGERTKRSCRAVLPLADVVLEHDGVDFEPAFEGFGFHDGGWTYRRPVTAVVLAGGSSTRMGQDKALLPVAGKTMIEHIVDQLRPHVEEILVSADDAAKYAFLGLDVVPDREAGLGPMMAVASSLDRARHDTCLVVPCDVPRLPRHLLSRLLRHGRREADVVVPVTPDGHYEPLFAVYRKGRTGGALDRALASGARRIATIYDQLSTTEIPLSPEEELVNVNTAEEYGAVVEQDR